MRPERGRLSPTCRNHRSARLSFRSPIEVVREPVDRIVAWQQGLGG